MTADAKIWLTEIIEDYLKDSPDNSLRMEPDEKALTPVIARGQCPASSERLRELAPGYLADNYP